MMRFVPSRAITPICIGDTELNGIDLASTKKSGKSIRYGFICDALTFVPFSLKSNFCVVVLFFENPMITQ